MGYLGLGLGKAHENVFLDSTHRLGEQKMTPPLTRDTRRESCLNGCLHGGFVLS